MIHELKNNFERQMQDLKGQMREQQNIFQDKFDRLYEQ